MNTLCLPQAIYECQTQKPKGGAYVTLASCKNLDRVSRYQFEKKILSVPTGGSLTSFALISEKKLAGLSSERVLQFFNIVTDGCKPQTKRVRFSHLSSFFNFLKK